MTDRLEINWKLDGFVDEQRYYCSETPIDVNNLPEPKATIFNNLKSYTDYDVILGKHYYIRLGALKNGVQKISEQVSVKVGIIDPISSATSTSNQNTLILKMNVPAGALLGDLLLVVLKTRADRSFEIPAGWSSFLETSIPSNSTSNTDNKVYIISKKYEGETSLSFNQSVTAACSGMIVLLKGDIVNIKHSFTSPINFQKINNDSYILALTFDNNYPVVSDNNPRVISPSGYSQIGHSYFISSTEFYGIFADKSGLEASGNKVMSVNWPGSNGSMRLLVVIEIL